MPLVTFFEQSPAYSFDVQCQRDPDGRVRSHAVQIGHISLTQEEEAIINTLGGMYRDTNPMNGQVIDVFSPKAAGALTPDQRSTVQAIFDAFSQIEAWDAARSDAHPNGLFMEEVRFGHFRTTNHLGFHRDGRPDKSSTVRSVAFGDGGPTRIGEGFVDPSVLDDGWLDGTPQDHGLTVVEQGPGIVSRMDANTVHASSDGAGPRLFIASIRS